MTTHFNKMKMDMELRGFSPNTVQVYLQSVMRIAEFHDVQPQSLTYDQIRQYLHHLITVKNLSRSYVNTSYSAIKFFFEITLKLSWSMTDIPRVKKDSKLPVALSPLQVKQLFDATDNIKHKTMFMVAYSAGLRVGELLDLHVSDINSDTKRIRVRQGKGRKERYTLLADHTLQALRTYYRRYQPHEFLFPNPRTGKPLTTRTIQQCFLDQKKALGFPKDATIHSLRHSFATHLLLSGTDVTAIQKLMGHESIRTTSVYLHLTQQDVLKVVSPLDTLEVFHD